MRKLTIMLIMTILAILLCLPPFTATANESSSITPQEVEGNWVGVMTFENHSSIWNEFQKTEQTIKLAAGQVSLNDTEYNMGIITLFSPIIWYVNLHPDGRIEGHQRGYTGNDEENMEDNRYVQGTISRSGSSLVMKIQFSFESVANRPDRDQLRLQYTATTTMRPEGASAVVEETVEVIAPVGKGRISFARGEVYIQRSGRLIPATVGEELMTGDIVSSKQGGEIVIATEGKGLLRVTGNTRLSIPEEQTVRKVSIETISTTLGDIWAKTKEFLAGESFEVKTPNGTCGVRG